MKVLRLKKITIFSVTNLSLMTVEDLHKYKNDLTAGLNRNLNEFEKNFFLVAAGTFAFSVTFITDIIKIDGSGSIWFLFVAWFLMALSVALIMYAYLTSAARSGGIWTSVDKFITDNSLFTSSITLTDEQAKLIKTSINDVLGRSKQILRRIRSFAAGTFVAGISFFAVFIALNLLAQQPRVDGNQSTLSKTVVLKIANDSIQVTFGDSVVILKK